MAAPDKPQLLSHPAGVMTLLTPPDTQSQGHGPKPWLQFDFLGFSSKGGSLDEAEMSAFPPPEA